MGPYDCEKRIDLLSIIDIKITPFFLNDLHTFFLVFVLFLWNINHNYAATSCCGKWIAARACKSIASVKQMHGSSHGLRYESLPSSLSSYMSPIGSLQLFIVTLGPIRWWWQESRWFRPCQQQQNTPKQPNSTTIKHPQTTK